jgi:GxxExxY protein
MLNRTTGVLDADTEDLVTSVIGCALRVHKELGPGYLEAIYHDAMAIELELSGLAYAREVFTPIQYRRRHLRGHRLDLVVERRVVVELKAVERLEAIHTSQVVSYLKAANLKIGLLMNFNTPALKSALKRVVL